MTSRPFNSAILPRESRVHAVAPSFGLELRPVDVRDASDIEQLSVAQRASMKSPGFSTGPSSNAHW
jgi:hypothetical protein